MNSGRPPPYRCLSRWDILRHLAKAGLQCKRERQNRPLVYAPSELSPRPVVPSKVLPVLARIAHGLQYAHAGEVQHGLDTGGIHRADELPSLGKLRFSLCRESGLRDTHVAKCVLLARRIARLHALEQIRGSLSEGFRPQAVGRMTNRVAGQYADGDDFDSRGLQAPAGRDEWGSPNTGEGVKDRARLKVLYQPLHQST